MMLNLLLMNNGDKLTLPTKVNMVMDIGLDTLLHILSDNSLEKIKTGTLWVEWLTTTHIRTVKTMEIELSPYGKDKMEFTMRLTIIMLTSMFTWKLLTQLITKEFGPISIFLTRERIKKYWDGPNTLDLIHKLFKWIISFTPRFIIWDSSWEEQSSTLPSMVNSQMLFMVLEMEDMFEMLINLMLKKMPKLLLCLSCKL